MSEQINKMDLREFQSLGYLQEANRRFFHPLGLALELIVEDDGTMRMGGVWDYRNDPEGMLFAGPVDSEKVAHVDAEMARHADHRVSLMGAVIQPERYIPVLMSGEVVNP